MRRWELADGGEDSPIMFWEAGSDGAMVTVRHGEAGAPGCTRVEDCGSATAAEAYVTEAVREKERQGYAPVGAGHTPDAGGTGGAEDAAAAPDEDSFTLPAAWRHRLRPRWGGIERFTHVPHGAALDHWDRRLAAAKEQWTGTVLDGDVPGVDPELADAARRCLEGTADPVGAAVLAVITDRGKLLYEEVVDAWDLRHGTVFAARATVELFELDHQSGQDRTTRLAVLPEGDSPQRLWLRRGAADRVRTLLSMAGEDEYREVVAALAAHRGGARRRIVVSYLVPSETGWVAECCADPGESGREDRVVRAMLFESLNDEKQLRALLREGGVSAYDGSLSAAATVAEGVGPAVAALIAEIWRHRVPSHGASAEEEELFAGHEIPQPFPQLGRPVHRLTDDEAAGDRLERFENITVPTGRLLGLERRGWERDEPMFTGVQCRLSKRVAKDRWIIVSPSEGFRLGAVDVSTEQSLEFIGLSEQPSAWNPPGEPSRLAFAELDPVTASELLADLTDLVTR